MVAQIYLHISNPIYLVTNIIKWRFCKSLLYSPPFLLFPPSSIPSISKEKKYRFYLPSFNTLLSNNVFMSFIAFIYLWEPQEMYLVFSFFVYHTNTLKIFSSLRTFWDHANKFNYLKSGLHFFYSRQFYLQEHGQMTNGKALFCIWNYEYINSDF